MSADLCIPCIDPGLKKSLLEIRDDPRLRALPPCPDGAPIRFSTPTARRGKRAPSAYNEFIGRCIKGRPKGTPVPQQMKACAAEWKQKKGAKA